MGKENYEKSMKKQQQSLKIDKKLEEWEKKKISNNAKIAKKY